MRINEMPKDRYPWLVRLILWAQRMKYGESLLPAKLWGRSPPLLYGLQAFYRAIDRKGSPIEPALRALLNVRVSQINHCSFCVDIGQALLSRRGVSVEKAAEVSRHIESPIFSEREKVALLYAEAMTIPQMGVDDELFQRLRHSFGEDEIVELTAVIAYQNLSSKFNAALDVPSQGFCSAPGTSNSGMG